MAEPLKTQPVKGYKNPRYPDLNTVLAWPDVLKELPLRWRGKKYMGVAVSSLLLLTLSACGDKLTGAGSYAGNPDTIGKALAAPVFFHGDGRGSFGCVAVAPPAFLSEEEAFDVIREEVEKAGIQLAQGGIALHGIGIPETNLFVDYGPDGKRIEPPLKTRKGDLVLDGYDEARKIAVEFVSVEDVKSWHAQGGMMSTVEAYNTHSTAEALQKGLELNREGVTTGVFYDPVSDFGEHGLADEADAIKKDKNLSREEKVVKRKQLSERQLREQVQDFIGWLKAQGVI